MKCPHCHQGTLNDNSSMDDWTGFLQFPVDCNRCGEITWVNNEFMSLGLYPHPFVKYRNKIPGLKEDTVIFVTNKEHQRWLQPAVIIKKDHIHYRLLFPDGVKIWMPEHWVKQILAQNI